MMGLDHCKWVNTIIYKAKQYGRTVIIPGEEYTSQTCGNCGCLYKNWKGKRIYYCDNCKLIIDRDINGTRCILVKLIFDNSTKEILLTVMN